MTFRLLFQEFIANFAAEVMLGLLAVVGAAITGWTMTYRRALNRVRAAERRVARISDRNGEREGRGIWISEPIETPPHYATMLRGSKPVIVVGNLKGGVGKTTVATNLAAHYAIKQDERVLLIDADYQGSASSMLFSAASRIPTQDQDSPATLAFGGICDPARFKELPRRADQPDMIAGLSIWGIPAYYDLAVAENRVLVEWVIRAENSNEGVSHVGDRDIRYFLTELLHHEGGVMRNFDRVIIDAPPRLTSACVQSFCAATHLLIPTVLDRLSGEAVATFVEQVELLRKKGVCPSLKILGVLAYAPSPGQNYKILARDSIRNALSRTDTGVELWDEPCEIPSLALVSELAGSRIAYATNANNAQVRKVRDVFDAIGEEVSRRI